jgi:glycolate oxidase iron-sulfur subunit
MRHCDHQDAKSGENRKSCILCGKCLEVCPLYAATTREELSPKAKFFLAQAMAGQTPGISEKIALELAGKCLSCGKCEKACPLGLCVPELLSGLRAAHPNIESKLWQVWVEKARVLWPMMATLSRLMPRLAPDGGGGGFKGWLAGAAGGLRALDSRTRLAPWLKPVAFEACGKGRKAVLFPGCVAAHVKPHWTASAAKILAGLGFTVLPTPDFACCGNTLGHAGLKDAQLRMQLKNLEAWRETGRPELVSFCATCRCGLRAYVSRDLGWRPDEREAWLAGLAPFSELARRAVYEVLPNAPATVHYHTPCHGAGGGQDADFLRKVLGDRLKTRTRKNLCCGFGGALKLSAPELSDAVAKRCLDFYGPEPNEQILTGCSGCVIQLRANAAESVGVGHWLEIIE